MVKKATVLIIEDDSVLLWLLVKQFRKARFRVLDAKNGKIGLELAFSEHPDCILLDIVMPKLDGISVFKKLRSDSWGKKVPIIFLTNLEKKEVTKAIGEEAKNFLPKSQWSLEDIITEVKQKVRK